MKAVADLFMKRMPCFLALLALCLAGCSQNKNSLYNKILQGDATALGQYIEAGFDVNAKKYDGSLLSKVVILNKHSMAETLLNNGADPNLADSHSITPLMDAGFFSKPVIVKLLLDRGANVSLRDVWGDNAVSHAVGGNPENLYLLVMKGADVNNVNLNKETPLTKAVDYHIKTKCGYVAVATLLSLGANADYTNGDGLTPRMMAEKAGDMNLIQLLGKK